MYVAAAAKTAHRRCMSHEGMGEHACWRAHLSDSEYRRDEWIKSSLRVSDLKASLHQFVSARRRQRQGCQRRTTSCFSASSSERRSWTHLQRSLSAVGAPRSGRHGLTAALSVRDGVVIWEKATTFPRFSPAWAGPDPASRPKKNTHSRRSQVRRGRSGASAERRGVKIAERAVAV